MNSSISILDVFNVEVLGVRTYLKQAEMLKMKKISALYLTSTALYHVIINPGLQIPLHPQMFLKPLSFFCFYELYILTEYNKGKRANQTLLLFWLCTAINHQLSKLQAGGKSLPDLSIWGVFERTKNYSKAECSFDRLLMQSTFKGVPMPLTYRRFLLVLLLDCQ